MTWAHIKYRSIRLDVRWFLQRTSERAVTSIVWMLPRRILYWAVIRAAVTAAGNHLNPAEVTSLQMLKAVE